MKKEDIQTDEEARQFFQQWAMEGKTDAHQISTAFQQAMHNYTHARTIGKTTQEAIQYALRLVQG